jgi:hypothetical protein
MDLLNHVSCQTCRHKYLGADGTDRCRAHSNGLACSPEAADGCRKFEAEAGSDDTPQPWFAGAWCEWMVG